MEMDYIGLPDYIKHNKIVALLMVKVNGLMLQHMPSEFQSDLDVVYEAVSQNEQSIYYASDDIKVHLINMNSGVNIKTRLALLKFTTQIL